MQQRELFEKFRNGQLGQREHEEFMEYLKGLDENELNKALADYAERFLQQEAMEEGRKDFESIFEKIEKKIGDKPATIRWIPRRTRIAAVAAVVILTIGAGMLFVHKDRQEPVRSIQAMNILSKKDIRPGGNNAILTLSNGSSIVLDTAHNGLLAASSNSAIRKTNEGEIIVNASENGTLEDALSSITTPKGGQYQVTLADGTRVWLNAASSLKFPGAFNGPERNVDLTGEAYFEVARNSKPFKVSVNKMQIIVLGTHFNVMAYADESTINTTLLEGAVKISMGKEARILAPGQQARTGEHISVADVNARESIEWKMGVFNFEHETIQGIMRKLARWYDVDVEYSSSDITKEYFIGSVKRSADINDVLNTLSLTGLAHFRIDGRRIIVSP